MKRTVLAVLLMCIAGWYACAGIPPRPNVAYAVYDYADVLTGAQYSALNDGLIAFSDSTSTRIVVLTVTDLEGYTSSDYAYRVGESWGVGGKENNGVVVLLKVRTADSGGDVAISVGYGLEGAIPDVVCHRIIRDRMIPCFSEERYYDGICAGVEALKGLALGEYSAQDMEDGGEVTSDDVVELIVFLVILAVVILLFFRNSGRGGGSSGWYSRPGGFGGFGGSGGGGYSGGFSGGFGGGRFGGGGASGKFCLFWCFLLLGLDAGASDTLRITFIGDVMLHRDQLVNAHISGCDTVSSCSYDFSSYFRYTSDGLSAADFAVANMEFPCGAPPYRGYPAFSAPVSLAAAARDAGIDLFLCANNHICDRGRTGIRRTLECYDSIGVLHTGLYRDSSDYACRHPLVVDVAGSDSIAVRVAFINFTYGTNGVKVPLPFIAPGMDTAAVRAAVRRAVSKGAEFIIALPHWGNEYQLEPSAAQLEWRKFLFGCGVDAIVGAHPHVMQRVEESSEGVTMFSLGNFISNMSAVNTQAGWMFTILLTRTDEGKAVCCGTQCRMLWCPRDRGPLRRWTTVPVEDFKERPELFWSGTEYEKMMSTFERLKKFFGYGEQ